MATIKDVALKAGVSIGTVSKALAGSYTISEEQTKHVREVAQELGYRPNARAKAFAQRATKSVIFLTALTRNIAFESPHMFEIICGAESSLKERGYTLSIEHCTAKDICTTAKEIIDSKSADGLLIHASVVTKELAVMLSREEVAHIVIGKPDFPNSVCWLDNNNYLAGEIAARYLSELGHSEIAYVGGFEEDRISEDRLIGIETELGNHKLCHVFKSESVIAEGKRVGLEIASLPNRPTAIICANNYLSYGVLRAFQWEEIRVPEDISLLTFDDYPFAQFMNPALTTVSIDVYDMGIQAGKLLVGKIRKPNMHVQSYTTLPKLTVRQSTSALPGGSGSGRE